MDANEVGLLLGLMALADNRKPPEDEEGQLAMIEFWLGMVGDLRYADAAQAVRDHYRESREWIMPADIRQRVEATRQARIDAAPPVQIPPELADDPAAANEWKRAQYAAIADGHAPPQAIRSAS